MKVLLLSLIIFLDLVGNVHGNKIHSGDILFIILSQANPCDVQKAEILRKSIFQQAGMEKPIVHLLHADHDVTGAWTIFPLMQRIVKYEFKWLFICETVTQININNLLLILQQYSSEKDWFFGHELYDTEATIVHHFAFHDDPSSFKFPLSASGFAISFNLVKKMTSKLQSSSFSSFSIDPNHEFTLFLKNNFDTNLTNIPQFCADSECPLHCLSCIKHRSYKCTKQSISNDDLVIAVKTYSEFYKSRLEVVQKTWGKKSHNILYFGDKEHPKLSIINLGVPNTKRGHCAKTFKIMEYAFKNFPRHKWLIIVDDDTILGVKHLKESLSYFDPKLPLIIGERYGYSVVDGSGYDYITGGGGIAFSLVLVEKLLESGCSCPEPDSPDDMIIGMCLKYMDVPVMHSPSFHQARPNDYPHDYLKVWKPISFHKHWMVDPVAIYDEWFRKEDESKDFLLNHDEL